MNLPGIDLSKANVCDDSRKIKHGDIFIAVPGATENGANYISDAIAKGASCIVCSPDLADKMAHVYPKSSFLPWPDMREAVWRLAQAKYGEASSSEKVIGITGTNGKTTSAYLLECLFQSADTPVGVLGTINYRWGKKSVPASLTTPGALELHRILSEIHNEGIDWVIMEVSSHALAQMRVGGINFYGALFTNLTQDHLDFHPTLEEYFRAKAALFTSLPLKDKCCAINSDDAYGRRLMEMLPQAVSFGLLPFPGRRHLLGKIIQTDENGLWLKMIMGTKVWEIHSPLVGKFNALNLLGVQALGLQLGFEPDQFSCFENFTGVKGRLERIQNKMDRHIFVDYAHTPDALENAQKALKEAGFARLLVVFGCGGNRDRSKRPKMGESVAKHADVAILTSDNPRKEDPMTIIRDVLPGLSNAENILVEPDRKEAIKKAIELMRPGDALLIAGKGHEDYQILGDGKIHFSDQEVVQELLG